MKELIEKLNGLKITQVSGDWQENIPDDIWKEYFDGKNLKEIAWNLDTDTHRWYETSTTVFEFGGVYMGVNYITNMFSESQDYEDCYHTIEFMEMEEYVTTSYRAKNN